MSWFLLALGAAVCMAGADCLLKRRFSDLPAGQAALARWMAVVPLSVGLLVFLPWPPLGPRFLWGLLAALPAEALATLLYMRALKVSPLSLSQPFLAFTPLFTLLTGLVVLGEFPSAGGLVGVACLAAGAYGLNLHLARAGWAEPLRAIRREPGSWMMLANAVLYAYTAVWGRVLVLDSSPLFVLAVYPLLMLPIIYLGCRARGGAGWAWLGRPGPLVLLALLMSAMFVCHLTAIGLVQTTYMIAVKRLSPLFAMLYGGLVLGEGRLGQHLAAGGLMVLGAGLILLLG